MFDASSVELIGKAPIFGDIDLPNLSKELTKGYAEVVSARIAYRENIDNDNELRSLLDEVKIIASTYEAYVFLLRDQDDHKAAAFIAASAHQLTFQLNGLINSERAPKALNDRFIAPQISAALLYFISGYIADASEMINKVNMNNSHNVEINLITALKSLLTGNLSNFTNNQPIYPLDNEWGEAAASSALWAHIHKGINILLGSISNCSDLFHTQNEMARFLFNQVKELSQSDESIQLDRSDTEFTYKGIYTGQFYLASLLNIASNTIKEISLVNTSFPCGVNHYAWREILKSISTERPYLWPNHLEAINKGYLNQGVSSVVSFPTGGGKSTLSELKIATSLVRNEPVVFIVPTLALVDQVSKSLKAAFPTVTTRMSIDDFGIEELEVEMLPDISVMTPESLLVRMSFTPDVFKSVGLFVFDECHLLHSRSPDIADRRSIDAMLCLLRIIDLSDDVDILLMSAMIENNIELSSWLRQLINREVLALNIKWKPTRQAKGCIVYDSQRTAELNAFIRDADRTPNGKLTTAAKRELKTIPYSFFSLNQTWHSNSADDYKLTKLSNSEITLGVNDYDHLTANRNHVAASIATNAILVGIKTLIFAADTKSCDSIVNSVSSINPTNINLNDNERKLKELINLEFGGDHTYYASDSISLPHHGLLIKEERQLHESLFSRNSGVDLIVATSTLAQGINLPAECVIIAGNTRFDPLENRQQELDAHELLNAAGRAGRAGKNATGVVLVIPEKVVSFDAARTRITDYWRHIKEVFSKEDQCLTIKDPLQLVLDKLHASDDISHEDVKYFIQRLPVNEDGDCSEFIRSTFGAYQARLNNDNNWIDKSINVANRAFYAIRDREATDNDTEWHNQLASASGIEPDLIRDLEQAFMDIRPYLHTPTEHIVWLMEWMAESYERLGKFIRVETLERAFKGDFTNLNEIEKTIYFKSIVVDALVLWMQGSSLKEIELRIGTAENKLKKCSKARQFVIRVVPEIAYTAGILAHLYRCILIELELNPENNNLKYLSQLTRHGFDKNSKLALNSIIDVLTSRVNTHNIYSDMEDRLNGINEEISFSDLMPVIGRAYQHWKLGR